MELQNFERKLLLENRWLRILEDSYSLPNGADCKYYHALQNDAVMAIALEQQDGQFWTYIVNQYRHPIGQTIWQFPLGSINPNEQNPEDAARLELSEETGVDTGVTKYMGSFFANPGFTNQKIHVCVSSDITGKREPRLEDTEYGLISKRIPVCEIDDMIESRQMGDAWGITGLHYLQRYLKNYS